MLIASFLGAQENSKKTSITDEVFLVKDTMEDGKWTQKITLPEFEMNISKFPEKEFNAIISKIDINKSIINSSQDILRKVPGLFIAQHAGGGKAEQIFLRGFDVDHGTDVSVNVDGMPVNIVSHAHGQGYADLHFVIPEIINHLDYGKGAYYADYGDFNTASYVNFKTYNKINQSLLKTEFGSFNTKRLMGMINILNDSQKNENAYIAAEYNYTDGPFEIKQNFNRINIFGKYNRWITDKDYINLQVSSFESTWNASGQIPERAVKQKITSRWGSIDPTEGGNTDRTNLQFNYKHILPENGLINTKLWYSKYDFNLFSNFTFYLNNSTKGDEIQQVDHRNIYGGEVSYNNKFNQEDSYSDFYSGIGFRYDNINDLELNNVYHRNELLERKSFISGSETNFNAFSSLNWHKGNWSINPIIRIDYFIFNLWDKLKKNPIPSSSEAVRVSPKLNFSYKISDKAMLFWKNGIGFHSNDMRVSVEKPKESLPYTLGSDFGLRWQPTKSLFITSAIWYLYMNQEFVYVGDEAIVEPSGKSRRWGTDLSIRFQPIESLYVNADLNYSNARMIEEEKGNNYIPLAPIFTSIGAINWNLYKKFSISLQYRYLGERPANEDNSIKTKPYFINDLVLSFNQKHWGTTLQISNLFNIQWNEAQFATETQLENEVNPFTDLTYTPGNPLSLKASLFYKF